MKTVHGGKPLLAAFAVSTLVAGGCSTTPLPAVTHADSAAVDALKNKLTHDARFSRLTNVSVDPERGVVRLAGEVSSKADRADAGRLASSLPGVSVVYNEIQVHSSRR